jgi:hypothetical protein
MRTSSVLCGIIEFSLSCHRIRYAVAADSFGSSGVLRNRGIKKPPDSLAVFLVLVAFSSAATLSIRQRCEKRIKPKVKMAGEHGRVLG